MKWQKSVSLIVVLLFALTVTGYGRSPLLKGKNLKKLGDFTKSVALDVAKEIGIEYITESISSSSRSGSRGYSTSRRFPNPAQVMPFYGSRPVINTYYGLVSYRNNFGGWNVYYYDGTPICFSVYNRNTGALEAFDAYGRPIRF